MWAAAERVLQTVVGRAELTGQALVGEARRRQLLTLGDAHAMVALQSWVDGLQDADKVEPHTSVPPNETERSVAREAWLALEHAVEHPLAPPPAVAAPLQAAVDRTLAAPHSAPSAETLSSARASGGATAWDAAGAVSLRPWYATRVFLVGVVVLLIMGAAGTWMLLVGQRDRDFDDGVAAFERGARDAARVAFTRAAQDRPDDARPLLYLGRIAREDQDLARARQLLEVAVRLDPQNALVQRELAAALLADGQPELARRFYVRAVELDPTDFLAQGFLACALHRLGRFDEAARWASRAGRGAWTPCLTAPVLLAPPNPAPIPAAPPR